MAGNEIIGLEVVAKLDQFRAELSKIPDIGEDQAKALTAKLSKEINKAEKAARAAGKAAKEASGGVKALGDSAGKAGSSASKLAGFLGMISPEAAGAARGLADVADVAEVGAASAAGLGVSAAAAGVALLAVAEVAAVAYVAWRVYSEDAERAAKITAEVAAAQVALKPILDDTASASLDLKVAMGEITEEAGKLERQSIQTFAAYQKATEEARKKISGLQTEQNSVWTQMVDGAESIVPAWTPLGMVIDGLTTNTSEYQQEIDALNGTVTKAIAATKENRDVHEKLITTEGKGKASKHGVTKAAKDETDALKELNEEIARQEKLSEANSNTYGDALDALIKQEDTARKSVATKAEQIESDHRAAIATAEAERNKALAVQDSVSARETIEQQYRATAEAEDAKYYAAIAELRADETARADKDRDDQVKADSDARAQKIDDAMAVADKVAGYTTAALEMVASAYEQSYQNATDNVTTLTEQLAAGEQYYTDSQKKELEKRIASQKDAAKKAFAMMKAARMAEAVISTASAVMNAWNDGLATGGPWGVALGAAFAGIAAAAGAIQIGAIASQQPAFHSGGPLDLAPDEMSITARRGEYMLNPTGRAMLGDAALDRANAGQSGGQAVYAISVYKHTRQVDRWKADGLSAGDPIARAITEGKLVGHRSNRG